MRIQTKTTPAAAQSADAVVFFLHAEQKSSAFGSAFRDLNAEEFSGRLGQLCVVHTQGKLAAPRALLVGLGPRKDLTLPKLRRAVVMATRRLREIGVHCAAFDAGDAERAGVIAEAAVAAHYDFDDFKPSKAPSKTKLSLATIHVSPGEARAAAVAVERGRVIGETVNWTKSIANLPGNVIYPAELGRRALALARELRGRLHCRVLDKRALERGGFGGILAVGSGSIREPRLIVLEYHGGSRSPKAKPFALVGKAVTFDSGGICIKPGDKMEEMKWDKCGGCAVLGIMRGAALLRLPVNLIAVIAAAENMPSATSYRPGDIVTTRSGNTIEVINTDAEGRVILSDALAYACEQKPEAIVDFATLTGACVVALGHNIGGLMGNDPALRKRIQRASDATGERVWELPLDDEFRDMVKSDAATVKNSTGRYAGSITGGAFLQAFVEEGVPWAHLDIAGPAWVSDAKPHHEKGATAFGVRLMIEMFSRGK
ncbi:MAG: leucyl aminopeptidase [Verrucomicrobia bacterium]|nr:leucyl aminopeptidase [Verrucomicrobiota bacterium]